MTRIATSVRNLLLAFPLDEAVQKSTKALAKDIHEWRESAGADSDAANPGTTRVSASLRTIDGAGSQSAAHAVGKDPVYDTVGEAEGEH